MNEMHDTGDEISGAGFVTRDYRPEDAVPLAEICRAAIGAMIPISPVSDVQLAGRVAVADDPAGWAERLGEAWVRVACDAQGGVVGFGAIRLPGHIDGLFTAPQHAGKGIASLILDDLLALAAAMGARQITVDTCEASREWLERRGFLVVANPANVRAQATETCRLARPVP